MLRLLTLAPKVQDMVRRGAVGMGHARTLVSLGDRRDQEQIADRIEKEGLSVRQVERLVARVKQGPDEVGEKPGKVVDPNVQAATESLQSALGTRVRIVQGKSGGRLELHYGSDEELQRIYNLIFDAAKEGF
jgi:ParB family chromosome partitioning protein